MVYTAATEQLSATAVEVVVHSASISWYVAAFLGTLLCFSVGLAFWQHTQLNQLHDLQRALEQRVANLTTRIDCMGATINMQRKQIAKAEQQAKRETDNPVQPEPAITSHGEELASRERASSSSSYGPYMEGVPPDSDEEPELYEAWQRGELF